MLAPRLDPYDFVPPETTADHFFGWITKPANLTLVCSDTRSGCKSTFFTVKDQPLQTGKSIEVSSEGITEIRFWSEDNSGNIEQENQIEIWIDSKAPEPPGRISLEKLPGQILVWWSPTKDETSGLKSYKVFRDNVQIAETIQAQYQDTSVTLGNTYSYKIKAKDIAGNESTYSTEAQIDFNETHEIAKPDRQIDSIPAISVKKEQKLNEPKESINPPIESTEEIIENSPAEQQENKENPDENAITAQMVLDNLKKSTDKTMSGILTPISESVSLGGQQLISIPPVTVVLALMAMSLFIAVVHLTKKLLARKPT